VYRTGTATLMRVGETSISCDSSPYFAMSCSCSSDRVFLLLSVMNGPRGAEIFRWEGWEGACDPMITTT
jgi:hypothetical protein